MDSKTKALVEEWRASLTEKERALHDLAAVELKKKFIAADGSSPTDNDSGSYFPDRCHAFKKWVASKGASQQKKS